MPVTALPSIHRHGGYLPSAPLAILVKRDVEIAYNTRAASDEGHERGLRIPGAKILAHSIGIPESTIHALAIGRRPTVTLDLADRYLCATGRHLRDVYPWLYTDEQIAADIAAADASDPGIYAKHKKTCPARALEACGCSPRYQAIVSRDGKRWSRNFDRPEDARAWIQEWVVPA